MCHQKKSPCPHRIFVTSGLPVQNRIQQNFGVAHPKIHDPVGQTAGFYSPQAFLILDFQCRDDVSELNRAVEPRPGVKACCNTTGPKQNCCQKTTTVQDDRPWSNMHVSYDMNGLFSRLLSKQNNQQSIHFQISHEAKPSADSIAAGWCGLEN